MATIELRTEKERFQNTTLPETNSSPLKRDHWKRRVLQETTIFRGELLVLGSVAELRKVHIPYTMNSLFVKDRIPMEMGWEWATVESNTPYMGISKNRRKPPKMDGL